MTTIIPNAVTVTFEATGHTVPLVTLIAWKHAIKLEMLGLKRSGRSASAIAKEYMGMNMRTSKQKTLDAVIGILDDINPPDES